MFSWSAMSCLDLYEGLVSIAFIAQVYWGLWLFKLRCLPFKCQYIRLRLPGQLNLLVVYLDGEDFLWTNMGFLGLQPCIQVYAKASVNYIAFYYFALVCTLIFAWTFYICNMMIWDGQIGNKFLCCNSNLIVLTIYLFTMTFLFTYIYLFI